MKAEDKSFSFLSTPSYYDIPFFQRAYVWNDENWGELLNNLTSKNQNHFLGSIILKNEVSTAGSVARYSVIDGQQRLTTLSILLRACYDHIAQKAETYGYDEDTVKTCKVKMESLLFVPEGGIKQTLHVKINHSHLDKEAYTSVINGAYDKDDQWEQYVDASDDVSTSGIVKAYAFFRDELQDMEQDTIDYLWELLTIDRIRFLVNINLDVTDNEQAIFDTVNSAGVRLSSADTIKNLLYQKYVELLRSSGNTEVDDLAVSEYETTWVDAFLSDDECSSYWDMQRQYGRMKRSNIETFLHSFAVVEGFFNPSLDNMSDLSQKYRSHVSEMNIDQIETFLKLLHDYAAVFKDYFSDGDVMLNYTDYVGRLFNICSVLEVSTFYPFLLQQLYARSSNSIDEESLKKNFFALEKYIVLNAICKGSTKNYNNECKQLVDRRKTPQEIMDACIYITEGNYVNGLHRMTQNKLPTLLLFWVELYKRSLEIVDIKQFKYEYSLEHIMPQKWSKNWSDVPVYDTENTVVVDEDEKERVRSHAVYEIGNMTLLNAKLNSSISNGAFKDKCNGKNGKKGIKDLADFMLTKDVVNKHDSWDERDIYNRSKELEEIIREIWDATNLPAETKAISSASGVGGGRKELRLAFWTQALPILREMNDNEIFMNINPKTANYITGSFGVSGFSVNCVANYDKARVEMFFGKNKFFEKNKEAYDILAAHRDEIEAQLGAKLHWDRADEYKMSWITYSLKDVSITNKDDWEKMIGFLGEWSKKFRIAMLPYLAEKYPGVRMHGDS